VTNTNGANVCFYISTSTVTPLPNGPGGLNTAVAGCTAIGLKLAAVLSGAEKAAINNMMSK
jgi:hypothetical protein